MSFPFENFPVKAEETDHLLDTAASCTLLGSLAHALSLSLPSSVHHMLLCVFWGNLSYSCFLDQSTIIKILRFIIGIFSCLFALVVPVKEFMRSK